MTVSFSKRSSVLQEYVLEPSKPSAPVNLEVEYGERGWVHGRLPPGCFELIGDSGYNVSQL